MKIIPTSFYLSPLNLATLRLGGRNFRLRVLSASRSLAQAMQIVKGHEDLGRATAGRHYVFL